MPWTIPGTVLPLNAAEVPYIEDKIRSMFLGGGMVLSQVSAVTGLESYTIQNWVKRGFLSPPQQKKYSLRQLCRIMNINMLKSALPMEEICGLLQYINGHLDDESDDLIDDSQLYFLFIRLALLQKEVMTKADRDKFLEQTLADYEEPSPGARERVRKVLRIMITAWFSAQLRRSAEKLINQLKTENKE